MYATLVRSGRAVAGGLSSNPLVSAIVLLVLVVGLAFVFSGANGTVTGMTSQQWSFSGLSPDMGPDMFHD